VERQVRSIIFLNSITNKKQFLFGRYFRCLANGQIPPVKERIEIPVATQKADTGLTNGLIKTLHRQV